MNWRAIIADNRRLNMQANGILRAHKWWLLRRASQIGLLGLFMLGPMFGIWLVRGNFGASQILDSVTLSDPYLFVQSLAGGTLIVGPAMLGAAIVAGFYLLMGGRAYCGWVCPVNIVTDTAFWLREKTGLTRDRKLDKRTRLMVLAGTILASFVTGTIAWEFVNPVSLLQRAFISGIGLGWGIIIAVFLLDLFVSRRAWCSHICPVGAFYGLIGRASVVRVSAANRSACTDCGACFNICPEPHVIVPALKGKGSPVILSGDCQNCGNCIDSCPVDVFRFSNRFSMRLTDAPDLTDAPKTSRTPIPERSPRPAPPAH
ncbi:quinol dehydrogenase ferredoxin subunit NapH [Paracoccus sp. DMF-8]|uniref:quinol dehydrogenase ferredoxin subunit NapH n=1 Tax=Paracoccus sp. DMF-8 TaxID=3019445 RepID=UPI0023E35317|nr:quinol dehydrogenase ferredoxin subunit NapH [Paracoccus sp. DMF-8]MDF3608033.1 quinol dehydrogenase ferredoxin subunit NapH [Paracoccus sp. DMF-8]